MSQDDIRYEAENPNSQATANVKQTEEKAEDAVRDVRDGVREAYESGS